MQEFMIFPVDITKPYKIIVFDDGNKNYEVYENKWYIIGTWRGKVKLLNTDMNTEIFSISKWKILPFF